MKAGEQEFYIARLPETPEETVRNHVAGYLGREDALDGQEPIGGALLATTALPIFPSFLLQKK